MKKKYTIMIKYIVLFIVITGLTTSCKKASMMDYEAGQGAYFIDQLSDSTNYSFANNVVILEKDTVFIEVRAMGSLVDYDREIQLIAVEGSTATEGKHYKLPIVKLPANEFIIKYPVLIFNAEDLKTKTVRLELMIGANKDFPKGSGMITNSRLYDRYKINFNNRLIKPDYWMYIQNYFGEYSDVKYRFMIDVLGISNFMPDNIGGNIFYADFLNYAGTMSKALEEYEAEFGPKLDETDKQIEFPL